MRLQREPRFFLRGALFSLRERQFFLRQRHILLRERHFSDFPGATGEISSKRKTLAK